MAYRTPLSLAGLLLVAACSSGGGETDTAPSPTPTATATPTPTPSPSPSPTPSTAAIQAAIDSAPVANIYVMIGTRSGVIYRYQKGNFPSTAAYPIASATKMLSGTTILRLVEAGRMSLSDHPQTYLSYWTNDPADPRSRVTLQQLLSFTSGFNPSETDRGCISVANTTIAACAREFYERGLDTAPGTAFSYGPAHLQIAGAMAEAATGQSFPTLFRQQIADPVGMSSKSAYTIPSTSNPRLSGGGESTVEDYGAFLSALLGGRVLTDLDTYAADRTAGLPVLNEPEATEIAGEWHYGLASWHECDDVPFSSRCASARLISSPGAFGWTPWIDFDRGYWALVAMYVPVGGSQQGVDLEQKLQPLINNYLGLP